MRLIRKWILLFTLLGCFSVCANAETLSTERRVYDYLTQEMGLPSAAACGVLANMEQESAFSVSALGDGGTSYGLCLWHDGRFSALKTYCLGRGLDYRTVDGQLAYLKFELETNYTTLLMALKTVEDTANGAYRAGYLWCVEFERPADAENKAVTRGNLAKGKYWNRYHATILLEPEEEELTQEEVLEAVRSTEVTIPQPPEGTQTERYEEEKKTTLPTSPYVPRHRPAKERTVNPATAFAASVLFAPLSDGKKERFVLELPQESPVPA